MRRVRVMRGGEKTWGSKRWLGKEFERMLNVNRERICRKESERIRVKELKCEVSNGGNFGRK